MSNNHNIVPYNPQWSEIFADERELIAEVLGAHAIRIDHNGSTSVTGSW